MINNRGLSISSRADIEGQRGSSRSEAEKEGRARARSPVSSFDDCGTGKLQAGRKSNGKGPASLKAHLYWRTFSSCLCLHRQHHSLETSCSNVWTCGGHSHSSHPPRTLPFYTYESLQGVSDLQHIDYCWTRHKNGEMESYNPINRWKDNEMWHFMSL